MEEKREYRSWKRPEREERRFGNENGFHRDYENRSPIRRREEGNSYRSERNDVQGHMKTLRISEKETVARTETKKEDLLREEGFKMKKEPSTERTDAILKEETPERETIPTNHSGRTEDTTPQNPTLRTRKTD